MMIRPAASGSPMIAQTAVSGIIRLRSRRQSFLRISSATCSRPRGTMMRNGVDSP